ncbi:MAG: YqbH/XkdH family protein [Oscillospiraceae bacterium]|jgi:hypothetical protein|nr:YqbH/XkdH family protein [Oscillospiraceae bacterium]
MSIKDFWDHRCDIYHLTRESASPGHGLKPSFSYAYSDVPDVENVPCHFGLKYRDTLMQQKEPANEYAARVKLALPSGTDIRLNDKVIDRETGLEYTAQVPRNVRGNHLIVFVKRTRNQMPL